MLLKLIPTDTHIPFTRWRVIAFAFSAIMVVSSLTAVALLGFNFGVDFRGGITIEVASDQPINLGEVRNTVTGLGLGNTKVQEVQDFSGSEKGVVVFLQQQQADGAEVDSEVAQQDASDKVQAALKELLGDNIEFRKIEVVGPTVSAELVRSGALAVALSITMMLLYISLRFEWQFGVGAIVALVHDVSITLGMFAVTRLEFNLPIIAAILTIVGYSINDTVVVYDRIRENLRKYKKKDLAELIDLSINETLSRTVMTSGTTLLTLIALFVIGGQVLQGFSFSMIFGILIGTYSSIFVASPFLMATGVKRDWSKAPAPATP
ncbi:MAG TPA: protein translocase subunit SecF [Amphiplicatus sp.]|nr:protein translocase subunit SecF [Amphiplicatus sp.]MCB9954568.1 protein translocase subunit SecF [Caulobacterales bacterium]HOP18564.1 protein translocase subunit SecF [Amphiplicatus sp.]HRX40363.1 protein translocase subunit SecF [Parvularculaceae bacterium]